MLPTLLSPTRGEFHPLDLPTMLTMPQMWPRVTFPWERATPNPPPHPDSRRKNTNITTEPSLVLLMMNWLTTMLTRLYRMLVHCLGVSITTSTTSLNLNQDLKFRVRNEVRCLKPSNSSSLDYMSLRVYVCFVHGMYWIIQLITRIILLFFRSIRSNLLYWYKRLICCVLILCILLLTYIRIHCRINKLYSMYIVTLTVYHNELLYNYYYTLSIDV